MSEDPKRIWVDHTILCEFDMELCPESDVKYVRADLVDGLVKAVEKVLRISDRNHDAWYAARAAIAALKALEEEDV